MSDDDRVWTGGLALRIDPDGTRLTVHRAQLPQRLRAGRRLVRRSLAERQRRSGDDLPHDVADGRRERRLLQRRRLALLAGRSPSRAGHVHGALAPGGSGRAAGRRQHRRRRARRRRPLRERRARRALPRPAPERRCRPQRDLRLSAEAAAAPASRSSASTSCRASPRRTRTTSGIRSIRIDASGSGRATWRSAPTARSTWPTGSIRSSAAIRCRTARGTAASIASRRRAGRCTTPSIDLSTTAGQIQALLSPAVNVRSSGFARLEAKGAAALPAVKNVLADRQSLSPRAGDLAARAARSGRRARSRASARRRRPADSRHRVPRAAQVKPSVLDEARRLSQDPSPAVRREVALSLRGIPFEESRDILADAGGRLRRHGSLVSRSARHGGDGQRGGALFGVAVVAGTSRSARSGTRGSRPSPGVCIRRRRSTPSRHGRHRLDSPPRRGNRRSSRWDSSTIRAPRRPWPS